MNRLAFLGSVAALAIGMSAPAIAQQFTSAVNEAQATANEAKASQQRIDQLDDQTSVLVNDYRANLKQLEAATRYNASLRRNLDAQLRNIERLKADVENVSGLNRAMQPLMEDMLATLEDIVNADLPFELDERRSRVARLNNVMGDPSISAAQRYRLIVEAYQIENEYGRTIGAFEGSIDDNGTLRSGEFLRIGRVALIFKTGDDSVLRIWDKDQNGYVNLDRSFLPDVKLGLRMAKEQTAPGLLPVPVKAPTTASAQ